MRMIVKVKILCIVGIFLQRYTMIVPIAKVYKKISEMRVISDKNIRFDTNYCIICSPLSYLRLDLLAEERSRRAAGNTATNVVADLVVATVEDHDLIL